MDSKECKITYVANIVIIQVEIPAGCRSQRNSVENLERRDKFSSVRTDREHRA